MVYMNSAAKDHASGSDAGAPAAPPRDEEASPSEADGAVVLTAEDIPDVEALTQYFRRAGIDPGRFGVDAAKSMAALLREVQNSESSLSWCEGTVSLRRICEPVFVELRWSDRVLVEVEQQLEDGRIRQRNMLLAEKKSQQEADAFDTALRGLREELNLPVDFPSLDAFVHSVRESYRCTTEKSESVSYPGLPCVYITHYCPLQLLDSGAARFHSMGLLADEFKVNEGEKVNTFGWMSRDDAYKANVKGLHFSTKCSM